MTAEDLIRSRVVFDEIEHTYTLDGKQLSGITGILHKYICPDKYAGISDETLNKAAERGHEVHSQVQMIIEGFGYANPAPEVDAFFDLMKGTYFVASEYLVSDDHHFASSIDIVDSELNLYDIKTTSVLDKEYLSWQLSIYAYLFELQNPTLKVKELFGAHLIGEKKDDDGRITRRAEAKIVKIARIDDAIIADLLCAAADDLPWSNPLVAMAEDRQREFAEQNADALARFREAEQSFAEKVAEYKRQEQEQKELRAGMLTLMAAYGVTKFVGEHLTLTVTKATTKKVVDTDRLKADGLYDSYTKDSPVSESLKVKVKEL